MNDNLDALISRRSFLRRGSCAALGLAGLSSQLLTMRSVQAALDGGAFGDYRALVCVFLFADFLVYRGEVAFWRMLLEIALVVVLYDFAYYAVHRYPFHEWSVLRRVHAVHHATRHPRAIDSMLLHPAETCIGLGAFLACIALVGGVHVYSFTLLFVAYTTLNVVNHAGLRFRSFPLRPFGWLAVKHDLHHRSSHAGNYAFLTTVPDRLFGTAESTAEEAASARA